MPTRRLPWFLVVCLMAVAFPAAAVAAPDPVLEWNGIMNATVLAASPSLNPLYTSRAVALVQASVFDAVNGIERRYRPLLVQDEGSRRASARAAAVQAAYVALAR